MIRKKLTIYTSGSKYWTQNGKIHRDNDQPAVIYNELQVRHWYQNGIRHRDNGLPAIIYADGRKAWWVNDVCVSRNWKHDY
jgi:hypothetical protein